jgi:hypothetical protein
MNKQWTIIGILAGVVILLSAFANPIKRTVSKMTTRGYKNNNPGNLEKGSDKWQGEVDGDDPRFITFSDMPHGYRAIFITLHSYIKQGFNTISKMINRYAPPSDNNPTKAYIQTVCKKAGKNPDDVIDWNDSSTLREIVAGISYQENGVPPSYDDIDAGYKLI